MSRYTEMRALRDTGLSVLQVAKKLNLSKGVVSGLLRRGEPMLQPPKKHRSAGVQLRKRLPATIGDTFQHGPRIPPGYAYPPVTLPVVRWLENRGTN